MCRGHIVKQMSYIIAAFVRKLERLLAKRRIA